MHYNYTPIYLSLCINMTVRLFKVWLVLFILCLDQPGFTLCWVELARALPLFWVI
jgi:hypothetical protein